jgi:hypothetical protein
MEANLNMYHEVVRTGAEALTHLFFHCCLKDGEYTRTELNTLSDKIVITGLDKQLNFKDEMQRYKSYYPTIDSDEAYIAHLVKLIKPVNTLALYSYCIELCISDSIFAAEEVQLLSRIGNAFGIDTTTQEVCRNLMVERNSIETRKLF